MWDNRWWLVSSINLTLAYDKGFNILGSRQDGRHFPGDILKCIFLNENVWTLITISLTFVPKGPNNIIPALVQIMAWRQPGDKPLSEPMMVRLPTHICVTRPQWVKISSYQAYMHSSCVILNTMYWCLIYLMPQLALCVMVSKTIRNGFDNLKIPFHQFMKSSNGKN